MLTKKIWSNLAVEDLDRTTRFYTEIGFKPNNAHPSGELTSFCVGDGNFVMHFFLKSHLKEAIKGELADLKNGNEIVFTLSAQSKEDVDIWEEEIRAAGGKIVSEPEEFGKGYYGFIFADPDGHKFNVFYMKGL